MLMGFHVPSIPDFGINVKSAFIPLEVIETTRFPHEGEQGPSPSLKAGEAMVSSVQSLVDMARQKEVEMVL